MAFISVFDVLGPNMIGPSSSHTAGAEIIAFLAQKMISPRLKRADFTLYGSFAQTGKGHGTDKAIIAGLLGFAPDDLRIRNASQEARKRGMEVQMVLSTQEMPHPNTARIRAEGANGLRIDMVGVSLGGAVIDVRQLNGMDVAFRCEYPTLLVFHQDQPGVIRQVTEVLENAQANIAFMRVFRNAKRKDACMIIETDDLIPPESIRAIQNLKPVIREVCTL